MSKEKQKIKKISFIFYLESEIIASFVENSILNEPYPRNKSWGKKKHAKFGKKILFFSELFSQHFECADGQEGACWQSQEHCWDNLIGGGNKPPKSNGYHIEYGLYYDEPVSNIKIDIVMPVMQSYRKCICPFVETDCHGRCQKPCHCCLNSDSDALEKSMEIHCDCQEKSLMQNGFFIFVRMIYFSVH